MAQRMRGNVLQPRHRADAVEHAHDTDEMPLAPIGREEEARSGLLLRQQQVHGCAADDPRLRAALRVGKADRALRIV
ncbi:hypothetical protein, partial [Xanthobacter autotrophicus]|uniref:hypothetical protein n=1 Tax=Xanthobacter autotrophicus TaxID=280 RepID=UPI00372840CF